MLITSGFGVVFVTRGWGLRACTVETVMQTKLLWIFDSFDADIDYRKLLFCLGLYLDHWALTAGDRRMCHTKQGNPRIFNLSHVDASSVLINDHYRSTYQ